MTTERTQLSMHARQETAGNQRLQYSKLLSSRSESWVRIPEKLMALTGRHPHSIAVIKLS